MARQATQWCTHTHCSHARRGSVSDGGARTCLVVCAHARCGRQHRMPGERQRTRSLLRPQASRDVIYVFNLHLNFKSAGCTSARPVQSSSNDTRVTKARCSGRTVRAHRCHARTYSLRLKHPSAQRRSHNVMMMMLVAASTEGRWGCRVFASGQRGTRSWRRRARARHDRASTLCVCAHAQVPTRRCLAELSRTCSIHFASTRKKRPQIPLSPHTPPHSHTPQQGQEPQHSHENVARRHTPARRVE